MPPVVHTVFYPLLVKVGLLGHILQLAKPSSRPFNVVTIQNVLLPQSERLEMCTYRSENAITRERNNYYVNRKKHDYNNNHYYTDAALIAHYFYFIS